MSEEKLPKASIIRLARISGITSISEEGIEEIRKIIDIELEDLLESVWIVNSEKDNNTIMVDDVYNALKMKGCNLTKSDNIGTLTFKKKI